MRPFDQLVREHGAVVMRVCRAMLTSADAEEAWSETFLAALRAYPRLRPGSNERGWLVTIAHRKALDQLRAAGRRARPVADLPDVGAVDPSPADDELQAAVLDLSPAQREAVVLHHLGGIPYADIAVELGVSPAAARRRAADGIAALRARLGGTR